MPLLKQEADKLSNDDLVKGIVEELIERDDLFDVLPFVSTNSKAYVYNREDAAAMKDTTADFAPKWIDPNEIITEGAVGFQEVTTHLRIIAGDVDIDKFLQETESDTNDQMTAQITAKAKMMGRQFKLNLMQGDRTKNAKQFDGVYKISEENDSQVIDVANPVDGSPSNLTLSMLDQLADAVPKGANAFLMSKATVRQFRALLRAAGGTAPAELMLPEFGRPMLTHNGLPILVTDFMANSKVTIGGSDVPVTDVFAVRLNEADGLHGLYGGASAGMRLENLGTVQNKDATRLRVKWYCGLALKSTVSLARLKNVRTTA
jgi:hypothetical protein